MANIYVDYSTGNDTTGTGASGAPYKTIQKAVNVATRGDSIYLSDSADHILVGDVDFATGFTSAGSGYTRFLSWHNSGSDTIQLPFELTGRVSATIDGNGAATNLLKFTGLAQYLSFTNLRFKNSTDSLMRMISYSTFYGCEFVQTNAVASGNAQLRAGTFSSVSFCYFKNVSKYTYASDTATNFNFNWIEESGSTASLKTPRNGRSIANLIKVTNGKKGIENNRETINSNNTFVSNGAANNIGLYSASGYDEEAYNNLFYNFSGASSKPISYSGTQQTQAMGYNGFFDCNANTLPSVIANDFTASDVSGSGDPFTNSGSNDYTLATSSPLIGAGLGLGTPDIGAFKGNAVSGDGGSSEFAFASMS